MKSNLNFNSILWYYYHEIKLLKSKKNVSIIISSKNYSNNGRQYYKINSIQ